MDVSDIASVHLCTFQITSFPEPNIPPPPPPAMVIQSSQSWNRPQQPDIAEQKKVPPSRPWQPPAKPAQTNHNDRDAITKQESYEDWDDDDWDDDDDDDDSSVNTETSVSVNFEMVPLWDWSAEMLYDPLPYWSSMVAYSTGQSSQYNDMFIVKWPPLWMEC